jgi:hypothetical protein
VIRTGGCGNASYGVLVRAGRIDAATVAAQLSDAPAQVRRQLGRVLRAFGATDVEDAVVDQLRVGFGDVEAARLLPTCGADTAARLLPLVGHQLGN